MVPKKDGSWRPCGNHRRLSSMTEHDAYPLPHIQDFSAKLAGSVVFSKIDLVKGYHQIPVCQKDIPKTAIATPFGLFEFPRMPFGLKNAAQLFQQLMDVATGNLEGVFIYLDDVLVASKSVVQHRQHLRSLFSALKKIDLVINSAKCEFVKEQLEFLGHIVTCMGIEPLRNQVQAVMQFQLPGSVKALQRFLGMINFYRRFLPGIVEGMQPLTNALAGKPKKMSWSEDMETAFRKAKARLVTATMLAHLVKDAELQLCTDASSRAIAAAIHQVVNGHQQLLAFLGNLGNNDSHISPTIKQVGLRSLHPQELPQVSGVGVIVVESATLGPTPSQKLHQGRYHNTNRQSSLRYCTVGTRDVLP